MGEEFKDFEVEAPVLTLEPDLTEEKEETTKKEPEKPQEPAVEEPVLSPQEQTIVEDFAAKIDIENTNQILQYGAGTQKKMADFSDAALVNVKTQDLGEAGELLANVVGELKDFDATEYFSTKFGVVIGYDVKPERIVIRANEDHKHYLKTLPLHHSQRLIEDYGEYADFELYLSPTYDFVMKLLHVGAMIEVVSPASLRRSMKGWISEMYELYKND